jgi:hypothetical protein
LAFVIGHDLDRVGAGIKRKAARQTERRCRSGNWHADPSGDPVDPALVAENSFAEYAPEPCATDHMGEPRSVSARLRSPRAT